MPIKFSLSCKVRGWNDGQLEPHHSSLFPRDWARFKALFIILKEGCFFFSFFSKEAERPFTKSICRWSGRDYSILHLLQMSEWLEAPQWCWPKCWILPAPPVADPTCRIPRAKWRGRRWRGRGRRSDKTWWDCKQVSSTSNSFTFEFYTSGICICKERRADHPWIRIASVMLMGHGVYRKEQRLCAYSSGTSFQRRIFAMILWTGLYSSKEIFAWSPLICRGQGIQPNPAYVVYSSFGKH